MNTATSKLTVSSESYYTVTFQNGKTTMLYGFTDNPALVPVASVFDAGCVLVFLLVGE